MSEIQNFELRCQVLLNVLISIFFSLNFASRMQGIGLVQYVSCLVAVKKFNPFFCPVWFYPRHDANHHPIAFNLHLKLSNSTQPSVSYKKSVSPYIVFTTSTFTLFGNGWIILKICLRHYFSLKTFSQHDIL